MTQTQKNELIELIKNDCKIQFNYINEAGETCAIGCLAQAAGVDNEDLKKREEACKKALRCLYIAVDADVNDSVKAYIEELEEQVRTLKANVRLASTILNKTLEKL